MKFTLKIFKKLMMNTKKCFVTLISSHFIAYSIAYPTAIPDNTSGDN